ncbi:prepilin peptidase [Tropicibacter naphthalenivorans]|uniref:Flp pilus assembly protein, protease CpaA n=1 Tax=Tropicibacter naphthalenivorans TaxID=441103 RepID=A0A0P1GLX6_9RHOB|nr:prepilin peptidase [Tropicibacter naphthalenivorans]CUH75690.1 Flp pilus assembly protein, protease CpaA [Tropicibacter naphthalenivorans]SMC42787.1 prepilin peptidase CpaA [Tropicibacter naphthalenivorans]
MMISASTALWFALFLVPICLYVSFTDMKALRIPNHAVMAMFVIYVIVGFFALPLDAYLWRYVHLIVALVAGMALNAGGAMGAGDAKFIAAAAPFIHLGDLRFLVVMFAATLLASFFGHRIARHSPLRKLAPGWESWSSGKRFPMGLPLGGALAIYLLMGAIYGA